MIVQQSDRTYDPIAIVGIGCRFPGGVTDTASFWELLVNNTDAISSIPKNRFGDADALTDKGKIVINEGGYLDEIDKFDAAFFNISAREAELIDPQQRLMLELAFEAMESSGSKSNEFSGTKTAVYVGQWTSDYESRIRRAVQDVDLYATLGSGRYATAGRISYAFNFRGPSMVVDTHCSSSLVAVHMACQSLRSNEVDHALAGGVNVILDPYISVGYSRSKILSDYGRCRFGDDSGRGYVRSEGAGMVLLKRYSDAIANGDVIHGVIRSSVVNNDGQTNKHMAAPSEISQTEMLEQAYEIAGLDPGSIHYVEAHGTGTKVGDPAEINALNRVLGGERKKKLVVGSVKTNIGHTEAAAGIAGLIKTVLVLKNRMIPASLHLKQLNQNIDWTSIPIDISQKNISLDDVSSEILAGVNSFGITGTNAHVVLQEYSIDKATYQSSIPLNTKLIFPLSANSEKALRNYSLMYSDLLANCQSDERLGELLAGISIRKSDLSLRKAIVPDGLEDLIQKLRTVDDDSFLGIVNGQTDIHQKHKVVFVFPGQGSQWSGMGKQLFETEEVFKQEIIKWEDAFRPLVNWSLTEELFQEDASRLTTINIIQPALVAMEVALSKLWQSWGIEPDAVLGHSMGEVASAYVAGILDIEDAVKVICNRSALMKTTSGKGAMAYIGLTADEVSQRIASQENIGIAVNNSPSSTVVSGDVEAVDELVDTLTKEEVFCRKIKVDVASHSPQMDAVKDDLRVRLKDLKPNSSSIPFYSTVLQDLTSGLDLDADYWIRNLRQPVQFAKTVQKIIDDGGSFFLEMSPHPLLLQAIKENADHLGKRISTCGTLVRDVDSSESFLESVGQAWCNGLSPNWGRIYGSSKGSTQLPSYPWDRERYWIDESGLDTTLEWKEKAERKAAEDPKREEETRSFKEVLLELTVEEARERIEKKVKDLTGSVVRKKPESIKTSMAFKTLGIDSLMAVQLKEQLERTLELPISVTSFWTYATIGDYVRFLLKALDITSSNDAKTSSNKAQSSDDISDDDISDLLASELMDL